jgi:hypothetical protein
MSRKYINDSELIIIGSGGKKVGEVKKEENVEKGSNWEVTVKDLAEELGILPKSLRSRLRKNGYKKAGKEWGWNKNSAELAEIRSKFKN